MNMRLVVFAVGVVALLGGTSTASGSGKPSRQPLGNVPFSLPAGVGCTFPTYYQPLVDRELVTSFPAAANGDVRQLITGTLIARLTNLSSGKSITLNISGPGVVTVHPDGSIDLLGGGTSAWPFGPTDSPAGPNWWLFIGRFNMTITATGQLVLNGIDGRKQDLCSQLS